MGNHNCHSGQVRSRSATKRITAEMTAVHPGFDYLFEGNR